MLKAKHIASTRRSPPLPNSIRHKPQDADYPSRELLYHNPQTRGWHSAR